MLSIFTTFWFKRRIKQIIHDISFLSSIQSKKDKDFKPYTQEADAILLRTNKKTSVEVDSNYLDPVTKVLNNKGLYAMYAQRKKLKDQQYTSVTVFEIENFSKKNAKKYPQELIQAILKKVAYTISLYEQVSDVVARTDFNQFTIVFGRATKDQCFKDVETLQATINELKFKLPNGKTTNITIVGGFVIKPSNKSLDEAISQAKELMSYAKTKTDGNYIAQITDLADYDD